jgi:branched-chain amino acid transport system permease protein
MKQVYFKLLCLLIFVIAWVLLPDFTISLLDYVGIYSVVVLGLVVMTGIAGMISFGQAAFVGIGAYSTGWICTYAPIVQMLEGTVWISLLPWLGLLLGLMIAGILAWFLGLLTLNLSSFYLPLCTIAWGLSFFYLFGTLEFLGGHTGMTGIPALTLGNFNLDTSRTFGIVIWLVLFFFIWILNNLIDSREGRAIQALKSNRLMAESMGINTTAYRAKVFMLAALMASTSGWLYTHFQRFINPTPFNLSASIEYIFMAVIGGVGYLWGAVLGAGLFTFTKNYLQNMPTQIFGNNVSTESIIFGLLMLVILQYYANGLWPRLSRQFNFLGLAKKEFPFGKYLASDLSVRPTPDLGAILLKAHQVTKRFGGLVANQSISLDLKAGEIHALIGPNGAGKSTFFNILSGVDASSEGRVELMAENMFGRPARHFAERGLGRTFQHVRLLKNQPVIENVALGAHLRGQCGWLASMFRLDRKEESALRVEALKQIRRCGLGGSENTPAGSLSLGKQRIIEIARALAGQPMALLLDEPAAGLRHLEKKALADLLLQLKSEGLGILIIEHDMEFVMHLADRITVIDFGHVIAEGTPTEIQMNPRVLDAYLGVSDETIGSEV